MLGLKMQDPRINVAVTSLLASLFLSVIKIGAYILTGSLSVLAEFLHSSLDLLATAITVYVLIVASKPPDTEHAYGHGKAENIGSLSEALLILATSAWIVYEAYVRITSGAVVEASSIAAVVMVVSIVVDLTRSRALSRVAKKYKSQALEADSLHFLSDLVSSGVALGVVSYALFFSPPGRQLVLVDAISASLIAVYFLFQSQLLGRRALDELLDRTQVGVVEEVRAMAMGLGGVRNVRNIRARRSGRRTFVDMTIEVQSGISIDDAHKVTSDIEQLLRQKYGDTDTVIHIEPDSLSDSANRIVSSVSGLEGVKGVNDVIVLDSREGAIIRLHIETDPRMSISDSHKLATTVEEKVKAELENVKDVVVHIEPVKKRVEEEEELLIKTRSILSRHLELSSKITIKSIIASTVDDKQLLDVTCQVKDVRNVEEAHRLLTDFESYVNEELGDRRSFIMTTHLEP